MSRMNIGSDCHIHPTAVVGDDVVVGGRVTVGPYAVLSGPIDIGDDCWIGAHCVLGTPPEIYGFPHFSSYDAVGEGFGIEIGPRTVIRELSTVHKGSERRTIVGPDSFIMNRVSIEHDCQLGAGTVAAPGTTFAGHVTVGPGSNMGMNSAVHQRRVIGEGAMVGMGGIVTKDIPPFATVVGNPAAMHGANVVGMTRKNYPQPDITAISEAYSSQRIPDLSLLSDSTAEAYRRWLPISAKPLLT